ncbi:hypothetical protein EYZ11_007109 [Aspergillus tanneri]|uniref:Uncharacterized protein n=1 Tax=Aspergillus tanneri TaxID=1220188 RepID=A0A4V3UP24_9EURO|nr:hypothetical protein EYZ11_007109 [Aspergillus tanneri]
MYLKRIGRVLGRKADDNAQAQACRVSQQGTPGGVAQLSSFQESSRTLWITLCENYEGEEEDPVLDEQLLVLEMISRMLPQLH